MLRIHSCLKGLIFTSGLTLVATAASAQSVCPDIYKTPKDLLVSFSTFGSNQRLAELCGVNQSALKREKDEFFETMSPCASELKMKKVELDGGITEGAAEGQKLYDRYTKDDLTKVMCPGILDQYKDK